MIERCPGVGHGRVGLFVERIVPRGNAWDGYCAVVGLTLPPGRAEVTLCLTQPTGLAFPVKRRRELMEGGACLPSRRPIAGVDWYVAPSFSFASERPASAMWRLYLTWSLSIPLPLYHSLLARYPTWASSTAFRACPSTAGRFLSLRYFC